MCVVSMIMDHQFDEWDRKYRPWLSEPIITPYQKPQRAFPTQEEIDEFHRLLDRAREYDRKNNEPDCELEEKREKLRKLAEELGIKIDFV